MSITQVSRDRPPTASSMRIESAGTGSNQLTASAVLVAWTCCQCAFRFIRDLSSLRTYSQLTFFVPLIQNARGLEALGESLRPHAG